MPPIRRYTSNRAIVARAAADYRLRFNGPLSHQDMFDYFGTNGVVIIGNNNRVVVNGEEFPAGIHGDEEAEEEDTLARRLLRRDGGAPYPRRRPGGRGPAPPRGPHSRNERLTSRGVPLTMPAPDMVENGYSSISATVHLLDQTVYDLTHEDGSVAYVAVLDGTFHETVGKLMKLWHHHVVAPDGLYRVWNGLLQDPRFASSAGPLAGRKQSDMVCLASAICNAVGRSNTLAIVGECVPTNANKTCNSLLNLREGGQDAYDRAFATAATIVEAHPLTDDTDNITIDEIMKYDLYTRFQNVHVRDLNNNGVISHHSTVVGNAADIQDTVLLPMFLALDSLYPDNVWRSNCLVGKVNVPPLELPSIQDNIRLCDEAWPFL